MRVAEQVQRLRDVALDPATPEGDREKVVAALDEIDHLVRANPLQAFEPHAAQLPFFEAPTRIIAAFCGNRFGKTTALTVRALIECLDEDVLPPWLRQYKRWNKDTAPRGTFGRIVNPSFGLLNSVVLEAFRQWCPPQQLVGGSFDKAYKGAPQYRLSFKNGSFIEFMTHEQDLSKFGGAARHFIGYDEPPPPDIRQECRFRTIDFGGYEMFACTPLKVNVGWMRRDIFKKREAPNITVVRGSIHDNPMLDEEAKQEALGDASDLWRAARESGDFVEMGGLIYSDFERRVIDQPDGDRIRDLEIVVGIDPGIRNAAIVFAGFDRDGVLVVFHEELLQDKVPTDYAKAIRNGLARWGLPEKQATFVIDPAAKARSQENAETVQSALTRLDIFTANGQNDVEAGIQQIRTRIAHKRIEISRECRRLRDEADEYAAEDRTDGEFKPIKTDRMHLLDSLRYIAMYQPYDPVVEEAAPKQTLGWQPDRALPEKYLVPRRDSAPMGSMS